MQIAIDGPASAGKSTIAKLVATKLGYVYCDTGAMYRTVTLMALRAGIDVHDADAITARLPELRIDFRPTADGQQVLMNGDDVSLAIRQEDVTNNASAVSAIPAVRADLTQRQRDIAAAGNIVMDGRDIGTTVLPDAELKVFMVASVEERARRRFLDNQAKGIDVPVEVLEQEIAARDHKDSTRATSPLKQADDAVRIDTTHMSIDEVVTEILLLHDDREQTAATK
ncbi:cytidylate kinase [Lacticaseibacillus pantheris DSM 15945 = JCM 12539 = NBRC 106106]|uniref:Cytidylate kinase n=1 Tax=Lacticaseibacillus pantheris DSM 15945 = JCM 12539 = NBRC 106106 TaxID=1423783 RepID=A0A0R1U6L9_9LACO|nr:(d)CMP kinase [Lacticaseibacillus pantheris]KRL85515.1 cytidylate kinase [Lacticaseibacillus pantheris DSM 15945 = JCM 12539 = NBRC 106106]